MTNDISGPMFSQPLARYDLATSSWRTSLVTSLWDLPMLLVILPPWGMTRHGELFERPTLVRPTLEPESSSMLPTPTLMDMGRGRSPEEWDDWREQMLALHQNGNGHGRSLEQEALRLLPTPIVSDRYGPSNTGQGSPNLNTTMRMLPTPSTRDQKDTVVAKAVHRPEAVDLLNRVMASLGDPTSQPSDDGSGSPDPPPGLLF
jgi:hypothetical protein